MTGQITNVQELFRAIGTIEADVRAIKSDVHEMKQMRGKVILLESHVKAMKPHVDDYVSNKNRVRGAITLLGFLWVVSGVALAVVSYFGFHLVPA